MERFWWMGVAVAGAVLFVSDLHWALLDFVLDHVGRPLGGRESESTST